MAARRGAHRFPPGVTTGWTHTGVPRSLRRADRAGEYRRATALGESERAGHRAPGGGHADQLALRRAAVPGRQDRDQWAAMAAAAPGTGPGPEFLPEVCSAGA